jgi:hypothetical protein
VLRKEFFYFTVGLRYGKWKMVFMAQQTHGFDVWRLPLVPLQFPFLIDLHADPFEGAPEESDAYERWAIDRSFAVLPAQAVTGSSSKLSKNSRHDRRRRVLAWTKR